MHKLIKYFKQSFTKSDFYRYETDPDKELEVQSLIFCTDQMKERYLIYRDILMICPCLSTLSSNTDSENSRFKLMGLAIYGVNSNGRNVIFGIALGKYISY